MTKNISIRLGIMMFFQFFVWGTWYVTMGTYLSKIGFDGLHIGAAYSTVNWGAIVSPFIIGMIADRFFNAERVMGFIHISGAFMLWFMPTLLTPGPFFWLLLSYSILYMPTLGLANNISFYQMQNPEKEFPLIRVLGTIGWIAAGLLISNLRLEDNAAQFQLGAVTSLFLGLYSFSLPKTPPKASGQKVTARDVLGLDALELLKNRNFAIFIGCSLLISIPLAFYYSFTNLFLNESGMEMAGAKMTLGQASEIIFLLIMPMFFMRLGVKKMLAIGMLAWAIRYLLFAYGNNEELVWMFYAGIILHGICYDFFFVTGQIYVDKTAPKRIQASAQGFITLITYGVGMLIGSWSSGWFVKQFTLDSGKHLWQQIWLIPAGMAIATLIIFSLFFKPVVSENTP